jgi:hypothetical protein
MTLNLVWAAWTFGKSARTLVRRKCAWISPRFEIRQLAFLALSAPRPRQYGPPSAPHSRSTAMGAASAAQPIHKKAASFIRSNAATNFYKDNAREPDAPVRRHITE